jgi:hypothetical protein
MRPHECGHRERQAHLLVDGGEQPQQNGQPPIRKGSSPRP